MPVHSTKSWGIDLLVGFDYKGFIYEVVDYKMVNKDIHGELISNIIISHRVVLGTVESIKNNPLAGSRQMTFLEECYGTGNGVSVNEDLKLVNSYNKLNYRYEFEFVKHLKMSEGKTKKQYLDCILKQVIDEDSMDRHYQEYLCGRRGRRSLCLIR